MRRIHCLLGIFLLLSLPIASAAQEPAAESDSVVFSAESRTGLLTYGTPLKITLSPSARGWRRFPSNPRSLKTFVYTHPLASAVVLPMQRENGVWQAEYTVTDTSIRMIFMAFQAEDSLGLRNESLLNTNQGVFWTLLLSEDGRQPVRGAHYQRALLYTGMGGLAEENLSRALRDAQEELHYYPGNYEAKKLVYSILLQLSKQDETILNDINSEITRLVESSPQDTDVLNFALDAYRLTGNMEKSREMEERLIRLDPRGAQAAQNAFSSIMDVQDPEVRAQRLTDFLENYPQTRLNEFALSALAGAVIELDDSLRMLSVGDRLLQEADSPAAASALAGLAGALSEKQLQLDRAAVYARRAIALIETGGARIKPPEMSEQEWHYQRANTLARYKDILGWILYQQGRTQESLLFLSDAAEQSFQPGIFAHYARALQAGGDVESAMTWYARAASYPGDVAEEAYETLDSLWTRQGRDPQELEAFIGSEFETISQAYEKRVLSFRSVRPAPDFELETLGGDWIRLSDQQGGPVVICFWATWSESSPLMLDQLAALSEAYGDDVLFLTIALDDDEGEIWEFIRNHGLRFPVLLDDGTARAWDLRGVPTLFVLDARGRIHFEHRGARPDLVEVAAVELDDLLGE